MVASEATAAVPIIDVSAFAAGDDRQERLATARAIDTACEQYGFLVVAGHGVPAESIQAMRDVSAAFFALPVEEKMRVVARSASHSPRGYVPFASKSHSSEADAPPDLMEILKASLDEVKAGSR